MPVSAVARVQPVRTPDEQWRENQQPAIFVTSELASGEGGLGTAVAEVRRTMAGVSLPPGYHWQMGGHYHLLEEVPIGIKPLQIDILLLLKEKGELSASARQLLAGLVEYLNEFTLIEFKSPSDTLRAGDFQTFWP